MREVRKATDVSVRVRRERKRASASDDAGPRFDVPARVRNGGHMESRMRSIRVCMGDILNQIDRMLAVTDYANKS